MILKKFHVLDGFSSIPHFVHSLTLSVGAPTMVVTVESSHNSETTAMAGLQLPVVMNETNPFSGQIHLFYVDTRGAGIAQWLESWTHEVRR